MTRDDNSFENKKWFFIYHSVNPNIWSTPKGFSAALKKLGIKVNLHMLILLILIFHQINILSKTKSK